LSGTGTPRPLKALMTPEKEADMNSSTLGPPRLGHIAHARSGDKGSGANIGVIAYSEEAYAWLVEHLSADNVAQWFSAMNPGHVQRYELPNLLALNFVLPTILDGGGSRNMRIDAQGKALGQALLEMPIDAPAHLARTGEEPV